MPQVPDLESFNKLVRRVEAVEEENEFLRALLLGERWMNREQAKAALGCKDDKLRLLRINKTLVYRYEGKKPFYDAFSIRSYLTAHKIDESEANRRIISARFHQ